LAARDLEAGVEQQFHSLATQNRQDVHSITSNREALHSSFLHGSS